MVTNITSHSIMNNYEHQHNAKLVLHAFILLNVLLSATDDFRCEADIRPDLKEKLTERLKDFRTTPGRLQKELLSGVNVGSFKAMFYVTKIVQKSRESHFHRTYQ